MAFGRGVQSSRLLKVFVFWDRSSLWSSGSSCLSLLGSGMTGIMPSCPPQKGLYMIEKNLNSSKATIVNRTDSAPQCVSGNGTLQAGHWNVGRINTPKSKVQPATVKAKQLVLPYLGSHWLQLMEGWTGYCWSAGGWPCGSTGAWHCWPCRVCLERWTCAPFAVSPGLSAPPSSRPAPTGGTQLVSLHLDHTCSKGIIII